MTVQPNAWSGPEQAPEPDTGARAAWLAAFTCTWLLRLLIASSLFALVMLVVQLVVEPSTFDRTVANLDVVAAAMRLAALVGLAALTRSRWLIIASALAIVGWLVLGASLVLSMTWSNIALGALELPLVLLVSSLFVVIGLVRLTSPSPLTIALGVATFGCDAAAKVASVVSHDPFARFDTLVLAHGVTFVALVVVCLARRPRVDARTLTARSAPAPLTALSGLWVGPFLMLALGWFVAIVGSLSTTLAVPLQAGLVLVDGVSAWLVWRGARALAGARVPSSVIAAATIAVTLMTVGALLSLAGGGLFVLGSATRGPANLAAMRELADPLFMGAGVASCYAVALAARWTGEDDARSRASLAARFGLASFVTYLPPLASAPSSGRTLGSLALDIVWMSGIVILWRAVEVIRPALARRAFIDAL